MKYPGEVVPWDIFEFDRARENLKILTKNRGTARERERERESPVVTIFLFCRTRRTLGLHRLLIDAQNENYCVEYFGPGALFLEFNVYFTEKKNLGQNIKPTRQRFEFFFFSNKIGN